MRQHMPFIFGQNGFGAAIVSILRPPFLEVLDLAVLATEGALPLL